MSAATTRRAKPKYPPRWRFIDWTARWGHLAAQFQLEPRDLWVGVFWKFDRWTAGITGRDSAGTYSARPWSLHLYVCIVPLVPLHIYVERMVRP